MHEQNPVLLIGTAFAYALLIVAYVTGFKILRMSRLPDWETVTGKNLPPALQAHMAWGGVAGFFLFLGSLNAVTGSGATTLPMLIMAATALVVITGIARVYMGGSGRLHMLAAFAAITVFIAGLMELGIRLGGLL